MSNQASKKNKTPKKRAMIVIIITNLSSSCLRGLLIFLSEEERSAIWPRVVLSPIRTTTPLPWPSLQRVPKKARLLVSRGFSGWVHSTVLRRGSDSPVRGELSTFISLDIKIRTSAGIFSPAFIITISPTTTLRPSTYLVVPSLITVHCYGRKFLNDSISASDLAVY